ncbi:hypothetical protein N9007_01640 [bacterium]|nr:hypothetical protein [bacterium]
MTRRFSIINLLAAVAILAVAFSWAAAFRTSHLPDGYIWSEKHLSLTYPTTPTNFESDSPIEFEILGVKHEYEHGEELYRKHYFVGWWICRRNFYEGTAGFPFDSTDWEYLDSANKLSGNDWRMHPQTATRDGCRGCSNQIQELLKNQTPDELRSKLIHSRFERFSMPLLFTALAAVLIYLRLRTRAKQPQNQGAG